MVEPNKAFFVSDGEKKFRTYKFVETNDFAGTEKEIVFKSQYIDGGSINDLLNMFRQFLVALTYSEETAKKIVCLEDYELEQLGISLDDLFINTFDER